MHKGRINDTRGVQRDGLDLDSHDLCTLQFLEHAIEALVGGIAASLGILCGTQSLVRGALCAGGLLSRLVGCTLSRVCGVLSGLGRCLHCIKLLLSNGRTTGYYSEAGEECRYAKSLGVRMSINPDAHDAAHISDIRYGVGIARKGWLEAKDILNARPAEEFIEAVKRG